MDPLSITGAVIAIVNLTGTCLKLGKRCLGPSQHTTASLTALTQELYCFNGAIKSLQTHLEINEEDEARRSILACLEGPLQDCDNALRLLEERLKTTTFTGRHLVGRAFDKKLDDSLDVLRKGRGLFEIVLLADQRTIVGAIERYTINIAEDLRDMQASLDAGGKLMRSLSGQFDMHSDQTGKKHAEMVYTMRSLDYKLSKWRYDTKKSNRDRKWAGRIALASTVAIQLAIQLAMTLLFICNHQH